MGIGVSLLLIAAGAILLWGVTGEVAGIDIDAIGVILMVVGLIGGLLSLIFWSSWGGPAGVSRRRTTYVDEGPPRLIDAPRGGRPAASRKVSAVGSSTANDAVAVTLSRPAIRSTSSRQMGGAKPPSQDRFQATRGAAGSAYVHP